MKRESVVSANIASVGYDEEAEILEIEFKSGGVYQYSHVPKRVHKNLLGAKSVGNYFFTSVKGQYDFEKIG